MKIEINGNIGRTYCENLSLIFFPGEKFGASDSSDRTLRVSVYTDRGSVRAEAVFISGDKTSRGTGFFAADDRRAEKIAVGRAVLEAGTEMLGSAPPWGILTGVRPAKISNSMAACGMTEEEIALKLQEVYSVAPEKALLLAGVTEEEKDVSLAAGKDTCSVYVSIPFCPTRCAYCSFVSYSTPRYLSLIPDYVERLLDDIDAAFRRADSDGKRVISVYIGGGTPTVLDAKTLDRVLGAVEKNLVVRPLEFTVEAGRPDTVDRRKLEIMRSHGVTRVSINPQILDDGILCGIGRRHTVADFFEAYSLARQAGFETVNTDLIAGLPGSDRNIFDNTLRGVIGLDPENVTVHTFCVKKSSSMAEKAAEDGAGDVYSYSGGDTPLCVSDSQKMLIEAGYRPYYIYRQKNARGNLENVGFSRPGHKCLYNVFMMEELHNIYACGAGAVTKITDTPDGRIIREISPKYTYEYLDRKK